MCSALPKFKSPTWFPYPCHWYWSLGGHGQISGSEAQMWLKPHQQLVLVGQPYFLWLSSGLRVWGGRWVGQGRQTEGSVVLWKLKQSNKLLGLLSPLIDLYFCSVGNSCHLMSFCQYSQSLAEGTVTPTQWWEEPSQMVLWMCVSIFFPSFSPKF